MKRVAIIGLGTMGSAIRESLKNDYQVAGFKKGDDLRQIKQCEAVIIAVKPQSFIALSNDLKQYIDDQIVLSIMAGITCKQIAERLNTRSIVRSMPNLGLSKTKSLTGAYSFDQAKPRALDKLLKLWGNVLWLEKEADFDAFTALAGSGPAYFLEMANQLQQTARKLGFEEESAKYIANNTLISAAAVIDNQTAAVKVKKVASKGGTTEAALAVLARRDFNLTINEAVLAAMARSKEISQ